MDTIKNCSNCQRHVGKKTIDDVDNECIVCVSYERTLGYYPSWKPMYDAHEQAREAGWQGYDKIVFMEQDNVNHPNHYKTGGIETIDYILAKLGKEGTIAYCMGNVIKYTSRWQDKGGLEDLKKATWYLNYAINLMEQE